MHRRLTLCRAVLLAVAWAEDWPQWRGPQRIFLWQDLAGEPSPLPASLSPVYVIARSGGKEIVSNQPVRPNTDWHR